MTGRIRFAGIAFDPVDRSGALAWLRARSARDAFSWVVTPNVDHCVRLADAGPASILRAAYDRAGLCLCDSRVLALLARLRGRRLVPAPGSDLVAALLAGLEPGRQVLLIGGDEAMRRTLEGLVPQARVSLHSPPPRLRERPLAMAACVEAALAIGADYVLLAVGSPQQELLVHALSLRPEARGTALCVGAAVEFLTGRKRRAPRWMQRLALEWLYRLLAEPRRLARRYLVDGPRILRIAARS